MKVDYDLDEGCGSHPCKRAIGLSIVLAFIQLNPKGRVPMKRIKLTQGKVALVDDIDYDWLAQWKWQARRQQTGNYYAYRHLKKINGRSYSTAMHRVILDLPIGDKRDTDHIDGNGLNNCRSNLRICTNSQNQANRRKLKSATSLYRGVCWPKKDRKWRATIYHNNKQIHLGMFTKEVQAAKAYDVAACEYFGEFARPNFAHAEGK